MRGLKQATLALMISSTALIAGESKMELAPNWEYVADTVMGGVSTGQLSQTQVAGRNATQLTGEVSLKNNGGFIQMAFDLSGGDPLDVSEWEGIEMEVRSNGAEYEMRLRTDQLEKPWQSFRAAFDSTNAWQTVRLPWDAFEGRKTDAVFDPTRLRRIGILAIGAEMQADVAIASIRFYR